jgi:hypothetical protein
MPNLGNETTVSGTDVWLTPPYILRELGEFDLDPCASLDRPWDTAKHHFTIEDDGLSKEWFGRVWLNPPYGPPMAQWLDRLSRHPGGGIALIFARTETKAFFDYVWDRADAILFVKGRIKFHLPSGGIGGTAGSPSVLIAYGQNEVETLRKCQIAGKLVTLR